MEIKFPKKLKIGCYNFKIVTNPKEGGGTFNFGDGTITIGTKYLQEDPDSVFNVICHEVLEATHCATNTRYRDPSTGDNYKFFMDHKEFENNTMLFSIAIQNFIK